MRSFIQPVLRFFFIETFPVSMSLSNCSGKDSTQSVQACIDDCNCKYDNICMPGCKTWAGGSAILFWGMFVGLFIAASVSLP